MRYAYDMLGSRIHQLSMEAGARWMLNDVAGKPIRAWDSRGHNFTTTYDALRRPLEQTVRGTIANGEAASDPRTLNRDILVDKIEYGEALVNAEALNLRTRIYRHSDSAGVATNARLAANGTPIEAHDFKGNLLRSTRRLVTDYKAIPDWLLPAEPQLDAEFFEGSTRYDALNRPIQSVAPHSSLSRPGHPNKFNVIQHVFNEANLLERVDVWLERAAEPAGLLNPAAQAPSPVGVANIDYDAKGQRTLIDYKTSDATVIRTTYAYDRETFRLMHLFTRRGVDPTTAQGVAFTDDCENPNPPPATIAAPEQPPAGKGCGLQNLHYTYDPAGNIIHIQDAAQQTIYFRNKRVEPSNDYTYDALYRLIQASGREHLGQTNGAPNPPTSPNAFNAFHTRLDQPGNGNAMGTYIERYVYDAVGNFLQMQHRGSDPAHAGWTRAYDYLEASLIEDGSGGAPLKANNRLSRTTLNPNGANPPQVEPYEHDAHGNMVRMPHLGASLAGRNMHWDYKDQLRQIDLGGGGAAWYVYDASGQRVRKVWEKALGLTEERIYLGGWEIFRKHGGAIGANTTTLERETLHVMDDKQRIALVETRTLDAAGNDQAPRQLIRYQFGNHLASASLELDEQAQIISYEEDAPYGNSTYQAVRSQTETAKRYRYTGKEQDEESGLYYHGARYYATWIGRWASCDPKGTSVDLNLFCYCFCRPIILVDPDGKNPVPGLPTPVAPPPPPFIYGPPPAVPPPPLVTPPPALPTPPVAPPAPTPVPGPGPAARVGAGLGGSTLAAVAVFLLIILTPSNAFTDYSVQYTDPDSGKTMKFHDADQLQGYLNRKAYEKRIIAPGADNQPTEKQAPGARNSDDAVKAPSASDTGPISAPAAPGKDGPVKLPGKAEPNDGPLIAAQKSHSGDKVPYTITGTERAFEAVKGTSVYILKDKSGNILYVGKGDVWARLRSHITDPEKTPWFGEIAKIEVKATDLTNSEALALEQDLIHQLDPQHNKDRTPYETEFGKGKPYAPDLPKAQPPQKFNVNLGQK